MSRAESVNPNGPARLDVTPRRRSSNRAERRLVDRVRRTVQRLRYRGGASASLGAAYVARGTTRRGRSALVEVPQRLRRLAQQLPQLRLALSHGRNLSDVSSPDEAPHEPPRLQSTRVSANRPPRRRAPSSRQP